jgi:large subunit ribosomal protein L25
VKVAGFGLRHSEEGHMDNLEIRAKVRTAIGRGLFALRQAGKIPGVVYGPGIDSIPIEIDAQEATKVINGLTGSTLVHLKIDQKEYSVLLRDLMRDSIRRNILHVDFYAIPTDRAIRVRVPLNFTGVSPAVRDFGGVLVHVISDLDVECLPKDLVSEISVDISPLEKIGDSIAIKDVTLPQGIRVLMDQNESVVTVTMQIAEEEVVAPAAAVPAEVEVIEKGKKLEEGAEEPGKDAKEIKESKESKEPKESKKS